ncbi:hypothetical protein HDV02_002565 [Globomyces sp. JEL0801]|nr:hypothetical protein HDV02_002565 [Globomyces sp. JEL0801]
MSGKWHNRIDDVIPNTGLDDVGDGMVRTTDSDEPQIRKTDPLDGIGGSGKIDPSDGNGIRIMDGDDPILDFPDPSEPITRLINPTQTVSITSFSSVATATTAATATTTATTAARMSDEGLSVVAMVVIVMACVIIFISTYICFRMYKGRSGPFFQLPDNDDTDTLGRQYSFTTSLQFERKSLKRGGTRKLLERLKGSLKRDGGMENLVPKEPEGLEVHVPKVDMYAKLEQCVGELQVHADGRFMDSSCVELSPEAVRMRIADLSLHVGDCLKRVMDRIEELGLSHLFDYHLLYEMSDEKKVLGKYQFKAIPEFDALFIQGQLIHLTLNKIQTLWSQDFCRQLNHKWVEGQLDPKELIGVIERESPAELDTMMGIYMTNVMMLMMKEEGEVSMGSMERKMNQINRHRLELKEPELYQWMVAEYTKVGRELVQLTWILHLTNGIGYKSIGQRYQQEYHERVGVVEAGMEEEKEYEYVFVSLSPGVEMEDGIIRERVLIGR